MQEPLVLLSEKFPSVLLEAHKLVWSTRWYEAQELINKSLENEGNLSNNIWVLCSRAEINFWKYFSQESADHEKELVDSLEVLEKYANKVYTENQPSKKMLGGLISTQSTNVDKNKIEQFLHSVVIYAYYYLCNAVFNFRKQERVKGSYFARKSWKYFEYAMEIKKNYDIELDSGLAGLINFGHGIFHFVVSLVPPTLQFVTQLIGFQANREQAVEELTQCVESRCSKSVEAAMILVILKRFFLDQEEESEKLLKRLQDLYPDSVLICYLSGFIKRYIGNLSEAIDYFKATQKLASHSVQLQMTAHYHLGYCHFLKHDWAEAAVHYQEFLNTNVTNTGKRFRPYTTYQLGFCYWKTGQKDKIPELYKDALTWVREEESYDIFSRDRIQNFFANNNQFTPIDEIVISTLALVEGKQFKTALQNAETLIPYLKDPKNKGNRNYFACYYYLKGESLRGLKNFDRAKDMLKRVIAEEGKLSTLTSYFVPYSWVIQGEMDLEEGNYASAETCFEKAKSYTNFHWQKILSFRIYGDLQKLKVRKDQQKKPN